MGSLKMSQYQKGISSGFSSQNSPQQFFSGSKNAGSRNLGPALLIFFVLHQKTREEEEEKRADLASKYVDLAEEMQ